MSFRSGETAFQKALGTWSSLMVNIDVIAQVLLVADYLDMPFLIEQAYSTICTRLVGFAAASRWDCQWIHNLHRGKKEFLAVADVFFQRGSPLGLKIAQRIQDLMKRLEVITDADAVLAELLSTFPDQQTLILREWNW